MRVKATGLACFIAVVPALAIWAIVSWDLPTQSRDGIEFPPRAAPDKPIWSRPGKDDPGPEIATIVISSQPHASRQPVVAPVVGPQLVRQMQQELKRLGCYAHEINGDWTPPTRRAMKDFLDRVNAVLPLGGPETVHLALLKGQPEPVCGATCPAGQVLTKSDQCLPSALIPSATKHASAPGIARGFETAGADGSAVPPARPARVARARAPSPPKDSSGFFGLFGF